MPVSRTAHTCTKEPLNQNPCCVLVWKSILDQLRWIKETLRCGYIVQIDVGRTLPEERVKNLQRLKIENH
jgi:hypothetical protein